MLFPGSLLAYLHDCLDWVPSRGACIDACLSGDVTRSSRLNDIALSKNIHYIPPKVKKK